MKRINYLSDKKFEHGEYNVHTSAHHIELRSPISKDSFLLWKFSCLYDGVEVVVAEVEAGEVAEVGQHAQLHHHQLVVAEVQLLEARPRPRPRPSPRPRPRPRPRV